MNAETTLQRVCLILALGPIGTACDADTEQCETDCNTSQPSTSGSGQSSDDADVGSSEESSASVGETDSTETRFVEASTAACLALEEGSALPVPTGEGPYYVDGFRIANDFPQIFSIDTTELTEWPGGYTCYDVGPPQDFEGDWWFAPDQWVDDDGTVRVFMATSDTTAVRYYGSDETGAGSDEPGAPITESISFDSSTLCPELDRIWAPDLSGHPSDAGRICMQHSSPTPRVVFVRI